MTKKILYIIAFIFLLCSCVKDRLSDNYVEEGLPARVILNIENAEMATKGVLPSQEKAVYRIFLYSFYPSGDLMSRTKITDINEEIIMDTYSGSNISIYAIANYPQGGDIEAALDDVATLEELQAVELNIAPDANNMEKPGSLIMVGEQSTTILPGISNDVTISMKFICAKVTLKITDNTTGQDVRFLGLDIERVPTKSYLIERGSVTGGDAEDAVDPTIPNSNDFYSFNDKLFWENVTVMDNQTTVSETVYIFENRRGGRKSGVTKPDGMTDAEFNGYRGKTLCAPDSATYIKAYFQYVNSVDGRDYDVTMNFFLGGNNNNDYNIERGCHYTYNVTIAQNYNMTLEVNKDSNLGVVEIPFTVQTSSSMMMDAHPSQRVVVLTGSSNTINNVSIEILDDNMRSYDEPGFNAQWAKISGYDAMRWQVSQNTATGGSTVWQQPSTMGNLFVRGKYIPHKSRRAWLNANGHTYTLPDGITLGDASSDYPDDDDVLPYSKADRRMCYKLTDYPFTTTAEPLVTVVYVDEYDYNKSNSHSRRAYLELTYTDVATGVVKKSVLNLIQEQPLYIGEVVTSFLDSAPDVATSTTYKGMAIETIEENSIWLNPLFDINLQNTKQMIWGHYNHDRYSDATSNACSSIGYDRFRDGYFLTANIVYDDVVRGADYSCAWSGNGEHFRPKYSSGVKYKKNGTDGVIYEGLSGEGRSDIMTQYGNSQTPGNTGAPYYYPNYSGSASTIDIYNPVFNSSAAQYCHEKNKDLDGDGILSPWETVWYLPSQHELYQIWISLEAIQNTSTEYGTDFYISSSEYSATSPYTLGFLTAYTDINKKKNNIGSTRCVRRISDVSSLSPMVVEQDGKPYIDGSSMPSHTYTTKSKGSGTGKIEQYLISENGATIFKRFRVAMADASANAETWSWGVGYSNPYTGNYPADAKLGTPAGTLSGVNPESTYMMGAPANASTGCNAYHENADLSDQGQWRLPTKRELMLMWIYKSALEKISGFTPFIYNSTTFYWSCSERAGNSAHSINFFNGLSDTNPTKLTARIRCIKEDYSVTPFFLEFVFNGGVNGPASVYHYGYDTFNLPTTIPTHPNGKTFRFWATNSDGTGTAYQPGASFTMPAARVTLYAIWQ